jgi:hypothetical protein
MKGVRYECYGKVFGCDYCFVVSVVVLVSFDDVVSVSGGAIMGRNRRRCGKGKASSSPSAFTC